MEEGTRPKGHLSLGQRVEVLERKVKKQDKKLKHCVDEDHYANYLNEQVFIERADGKELRGRLISIVKFTLLVETDQGRKTVNKGQIVCMSPLR